MSDVPADVIRSLLFRLPSEDLARCRCVCKTWKGIIDDSDFASSHLRSQEGGDSLIICDDTKLYSVSVTCLYDNSVEKETKVIEPKTLKNLENVGVRLHGFPVASCDGIALVSGEKGLALWNVLTGECRKLPSLDSEKRRGRWKSIGFGYDRVSDDYKVVSISSHCERSVETMIYSLKSDEWHRIQHYSDYPVARKDPGIYTNGSINWLTCVTRQGVDDELIVVLDLSTEMYRHISVPSNSLHSTSYFSVVNNCLVFSHGYEAWILKDYGGEEIWTKFLSLEHVGIRFSYFSRLLAYAKSKEQVLIRSGDEGFLWYHLQTGCVKKVTIKGFTMKQKTSCQVFPTSLIQLNGNKRKQTLIRSKKRAKLELTTSDVRGPPGGWVPPEN